MAHQGLRVRRQEGYADTCGDARKNRLDVAGLLDYARHRERACSRQRFGDMVRHNSRVAFEAGSSHTRVCVLRLA